MSRWCPKPICRNYNQEVPGTPMNCAACGQRMSGIRPPSVVAAVLRFEYTPRRLHEMNDETWAHYQERVRHHRDKHQTRQPANLEQGKYLYHATSPQSVDAITNGGLRPRDPSWRSYKKTDRTPRFDASKDGFLSMATTLLGAGAMGNFVLLRMRIGQDIARWDFRQVEGSTEVRTAISIPANRLERSNDGRHWEPLVE